MVAEAPASVGAVTCDESPELPVDGLVMVKMPDAKTSGTAATAAATPPATGNACIRRTPTDPRARVRLTDDAPAGFPEVTREQTRRKKIDAADDHEDEIGDGSDDDAEDDLVFVPDGAGWRVVEHEEGEEDHGLEIGRNEGLRDRVRVKEAGDREQSEIRPKEREDHRQLVEAISDERARRDEDQGADDAEVW